MELRVVKELLRLYPVSHLVYERIEARGSQYTNRFPAQLSGGQQQQVALASGEFPTVRLPNITSKWPDLNTSVYAHWAPTDCLPLEE
jgi:hypothetical protein